VTKPKSRTALEPVAYSVAAVAEATGLGEDHVYQLCKSGELPSRKVGRRVIIPRAGLEAWLDAAVTS